MSSKHIFMPRVSTMVSRGLVILSLLFSTSLWAEDEIYTSFFSNKAVGGYDTVSFFDGSKPVEGSSKYKVEYKGADWVFSSQANLDKFVADPTKYAPQYGGYCAWAIAAKNDLAPGKPKYWTVVNDKLYLNYSQSVQDDWNKNIDGFIKQGNINWENQ